MRARIVLLVLMSLLTSTTVLAAVPGMINYQGTLTDDGGMVLDTTVAMTFTIYYDSTGGASIWNETQLSVMVTDGIFNVLLGSVNPLTEGLFGGSPSRWLGVQVGGDPELVPRQRIVTVAHAFHAAEAETASYAHAAPASSDGDWILSGSDMYAGVSGNVGIGATSPGAKLDCPGPVRIGSPVSDPGSSIGLVLFANDNTWSSIPLAILNTDSDHLFYVRGNGDVGLGTFDPSAKLDVLGTARVSGFTMPTGADSGKVLTSDASGNGSWQVGFNGLWTTAGNRIYPNSATNFTIYDNSSSYLGLSYINDTETSAITNWSNDGAIMYHCYNNGSELFGIKASANSSLTDYGVWSQGQEYGGYFNSDGTAVYGENSLGSNGSLGGNVFGVYGYSSDHYGVYGMSGSSHGISGVSNSGSALYGYNGGTGNYALISNSSYGLYGYNSGSGNYGYIGSGSYSLYGYNSGGNNYGYIGGYSYGVLGYNYNGGNYGYIGSSDFGMYAKLASADTGDYAIYAFGTDDSGEDGSGYGIHETVGGVRGYNYYGNPYTFGVAGYSYLDYNRSGGCFGGRNDAAIWGSMGYQNSSGTEYGGYFTSWATGAGKSDVSVGIGLGSWGDLFGADIHGKIYGTYTEGGNYALYSNGDVFTNGMDIHLQKTEASSMAVLYTNVSTDVTVQTSGFSTLSKGTCRIEFDDDFKKVISPDVPIIVTVTPTGNSNGVYVSEVTKGGFSVVENNGGKSNVTVTFIAIGRRAGYEHPQLPEEVISSNYVDKLSRGLHNDAEIWTDGEGLFFENGELHSGVHPSVLPDPNKLPYEFGRDQEHGIITQDQERENREREMVEEEARRLEEERPRNLEFKEGPKPVRRIPSRGNRTDEAREVSESG